MTHQEKALYWFLIIATFGLVFIYWRTKKNKIKNELSQTIKISININKLINLLGDKENIKSVDSTHTKVKITFNNREKIDVEEIKNIDGISGVFATSNYIQIIVGNEALAIKEKMNSL